MSIHSEVLAAAMGIFEGLQSSNSIQHIVEVLLMDFSLDTITEVLKLHDCPTWVNKQGAETYFKFPTDEGRQQWLEILEKEGITRQRFSNPDDYFWRADVVAKHRHPFSQHLVAYTTIKLTYPRGRVQYKVLQ